VIDGIVIHLRKCWDVLQIKPQPHFDSSYGINFIDCPEIRRHMT